MTATLPSQSVKREHTILLPGQLPSGEYILSLLVKRTYNILPGKPCARVEASAKLISGDTHYGDPRVTPVKFESDLVPFKLMTDVVLVGKAYAPEGRPIEQFRTMLQVGDHQKKLLLIGDRKCLFREEAAPQFTDPEMFTEVSLTYDRAYGGVDIYSDADMSYPYPRNPLGRGFVVANKRKSVQDLRLPNIEDPLAPLTEQGLITGEMQAWAQQPMPQGYGWFAKYWYPRGPLAGVMPADRKFEQEMRAMYETVVPLEHREMYHKTNLPDMNFSFFNGASPGLAVPFLEGNELVTLQQLTPEGTLAFYLPGDQPQIEVNIGFGPVKPEVVLHTLAIRSEERQIDLVWRGAVPYPGPEWLPSMRKFEMNIGE